MAEKQNFQYYAFISYSHKDEKWAKWLQHSLENYRLPAAVRKERLDIPARIRPVFRDETDLAGGYLEEELQKELEASRNLIVICSPNSASSDWVSKEVAHFAALGRGGDIIPFIVAGTPHSGDPATECFPLAIRQLEREPLGIDVQELGRIDAFLKVISTLLDVRHDQIVMRHKRRTFKKRLITGILAGLLAIALGIGIWWNTPHSKYYRGYITHFEIPEGIHEMTSQERAHAYQSYRITTLRGKVISLERVNSADTPVDPIVQVATQDFPVLTYTYDDSGKLVTIEGRNTTGQLVSTKGLVYGTDGHTIALDYRSADSIHAQAQAADLSYVSSGSDENTNRSRIVRLYNTYDDEGFLLTSMFHGDTFGNAACDSTGIYGKAYEYTPQGQVARVSNLDSQGQIYNCRYGWASVVYAYSDIGLILSERFFDAQGNAATDISGVSTYAVSYDSWGNSQAQISLGPDLQPCIHTDGYYMTTVTYDSRGFLTSSAFFDSQQQPATDINGVHKSQIISDDRGRIIGMSYHGIDGELVFNPAVYCAQIRITLDEQGRCLTQWYYDVDGNLVYDPAGYCGLSYTYDENGYINSYCSFGADGKPVMTKYGYAIVTIQNDANGNPELYAYFDTEGKPVFGTETAAEEYLYDALGNCTGNAYYDTDLNICMSRYGYAIREMEYENGNLVMEALYDADGLPILGQNFYHRVEKEYDGSGNCVRSVYYDSEGGLINTASGYAIEECDYDAYGNITELRWYDAAGKPINTVDGRFREVRTLDSRGYVIRWDYYPDASAPDKYLSTVCERDNFGNILRQLTYGIDHKLLNSSTQAAEAVFIRDTAGRVLREEQYDHTGRPWQADSPNTPNLWIYEYDSQGNELLRKFCHVDASGVEHCLWQERKEYDTLGNRIRADRLNADGTLSEDVATILSTYTPTGDLASEEYYDASGAPTTKDGYIFRAEYTYDNRGNMIECRQYGTDGSLLREADGQVAIYQYEYDEMGNQVKRYILNEQEKLYRGSRYVSTVEIFYDPMGYATHYTQYSARNDTYLYRIYCSEISHVDTGSNAHTAGVQASDYLIQIGDWCLFERDTVSLWHDLAILQDNPVPAGTQVTVARMEDEGYTFIRYTLQSNLLDIQFQDSSAYEEEYMQIQSAYYTWLAEQE